MITVEDFNNTQNLLEKAHTARVAGGFCIAMGIVSLVVGTAVGVGCLIAGGVLRAK